MKSFSNGLCLAGAKLRLVCGCFNKTTLSNLVFCGSPLLIFLLVVASIGMDPFHWVPLWNDEAGWYLQVSSVVKYGIPLGFTGYDETHAAVGTFGPWGGFLVWIMALFGKIFGWHWYSPLFMNVFYMVLANFVFFLFIRPQWKTALRLATLNGILFLSIQYMFTGMSESIRFSMAVVLAGMFLFLFNDGNKGKRWYAIVVWGVAPVLLFFFVNSYIMFSFLLPVYGYALFKYVNPRKCWLASYIALCIILPALFGLVCFWIQVKTSAPYPTNIIHLYLNQPNVTALFSKIWNNIVSNYENANFAFVLRSSKMANGCISSYLFFYYFLLTVALVKLIVAVMAHKKVHPLNVLVVYALSIFVVAFLVLYSTKSPGTYMRGLNVALVFSLYIICTLDWHKLSIVLFGLAFMQFFPFAEAVRYDMAVRYSPRNKYGGGYELFKEYSTVFSSLLSIDKTEDKWANTIAFYGMTYNFNCVIPVGLSWNYVRDNHVVTKPRYIITDKNTNLDFHGYRNTYSDDLVRVFEKEHLTEETKK